MFVIGIDPHKQTHTAVAVDRATGELRSSETVAARDHGHAALLEWGRAFDGAATWAIEDCRHVSRALERFLLDHGERVVRVPPKVMAGARRSAREFGKSDDIDALAVARGALAHPALPLAEIDDEALEIKLLVDHREHLVGERTALQGSLRWHLHDLWPDYKVPVGGLDRIVWLERLTRRLGRCPQSARVRIARDLVRRCRELTRTANELERELAVKVAAYAPRLLTLTGCRVLTAARLIAETGNARRFTSDAQFARLAGVAPIEASSGSRRRHRLNRHGNRQLNAALHRIAIVQGRWHPGARAYLERKQAEGKSRREALRCLKRHLARVVFRLMREPGRPADMPNKIKVRGGRHPVPA